MYKKISTYSVPLLFVPTFVFSAVGDIFGAIDSLIGAFNALTALFISCAVAVFFWGMVKFIANADDEKQVEEGRKTIVWGLFGIFIIVCIWGIVAWLQTTLGIDSGGGGTTPGIPTTLK